jgi:hypothetical protein
LVYPECSENQGEDTYDTMASASGRRTTEGEELIIAENIAEFSENIKRYSTIALQTVRSAKSIIIRSAADFAYL